MPGAASRRVEIPAAAILLALALLIVAAEPMVAFDLQGHRGARGLRPENTLAGFAEALSIGVTTLETDLAITRDDIVVLSHDPVLNPDIVRGPDGAWPATPGPAIRTLSFAELARFDIGRIRPGSAYAREFPRQKPVDGERIPTLAALFALAAASGTSPRFNIETKIAPAKPDETPDPERFAHLVVEAVRQAGVASRTTIQSFDWRTLLAVHRIAPDIETVCLTIETEEMNTVRARASLPSPQPSPWLAGVDVGRQGSSAPSLVSAAQCATWSPYWRDVTAANVAEAHALGLKVVPWTVNDASGMAAMIAMKVDGLITDYPDLGRQVLAAHGIAIRTR